MGKGIDVFDIGKALYDIKQHLDTLDTFLDAAQRASEGKNPAAKSKSIEKALGKLDALAQKLDVLADYGLPTPVLRPVSLNELVDPAQCGNAVTAHWENLSDMRQTLAEGNAQLARVSEIQQEATLKAELASQLSDEFLDLAEKAAPLAGFSSAPSLAFFDAHQTLSEATGKLRDVASMADRALNRLEADISNLQQETSNYAVTLDTFANPDYYPVEAPSNEGQVGLDSADGAMETGGAANGSVDLELDAGAAGPSGDSGQKSFVDDGQFHWDAADHTPAPEGALQHQADQPQPADTEVCGSAGTGLDAFTEFMEQNACVDNSSEHADAQSNEGRAPEPQPLDQNVDQSVMDGTQGQPNDWEFSQSGNGQQHDVGAGDYFGGDSSTGGGGSR